jgi:hypothetical protein
MAHRFDATLKDIVADHPADFAAVFGLPAHEPATLINVDLSTVSAATDVALSFGDPVRVVVDLNFQSGPDAGVPGRLHLYDAVHQIVPPAFGPLAAVVTPTPRGKGMIVGGNVFGTQGKALARVSGRTARPASD